MDRSLKALFDQALSDEPPPPSGDLAGEAMTGGRRLRRRRHLALGGAAGVAAVLAAVVALTVGMTVEPATDTVMSVGTGPECVQAPNEVAVFLKDAVTDEERAGLDEWLRAEPVVRTVRFESREAAYAKFKEMYRDAPDLVAAVRPEQLPESFRIEVDPGAAGPAFRDAAQRRPGVEAVVGGECVGGRRSGEGA